jgi:hypothetical protein
MLAAKGKKENLPDRVPGAAKEDGVERRNFFTVPHRGSSKSS